MDLHGNDDLIDLSANISLLEIGIKKTNELNEIFTALENSSPLIEKEIKEDETVEREYEEIFVKKSKMANSNSTPTPHPPLPPLPLPDDLPIPSLPAKKPKKEKPVTVEMLDEIFMKKLSKPSDDDYEWMNNKVKFKKDDDMSKMCKYIDEHVLMESAVYFNINTDNYILDLDKLITKFERMRVSETIASPHMYRIIYKDPYGYANRRIEPWIELTVTGNKFTKSIVDGIHDIYVAQCKKYLTDHEKYKKNDSCGFKRTFELKTGKPVEVFCLVKRQ